MLDGGQRERDLAESYNRWAEATKLEYPRTSAMLREIARGYENHARNFDDEAERNDLAILRNVLLTENSVRT